MAQAAPKTLGTANTPYGATLSARPFADFISEVGAAQTGRRLAEHLQASCSFPLALVP